MIFQSFFRAGALDDFADNHHRPQTLFGGTQERRKQNEELPLFPNKQALPELFGFGMAQRLLAQLAESSFKFALLEFVSAPGVSLAGLLPPALDVLAKLSRLGISGKSFQ